MYYHCICSDVIMMYDKLSMDLVKTTWLLLILLVSIILKCTGMIILITNVLFYLVLLYSC